MKRRRVLQAIAAIAAAPMIPVKAWGKAKPEIIAWWQHDGSLLGAVDYGKEISIIRFAPETSDGYVEIVRHACIPPLTPQEER